MDMNYDPESNILSWEIAEGKIKNTKEFGNFLIHLGEKNKPVLIEILDASKFVGQTEKTLKRNEIEKAISTN